MKNYTTFQFAKDLLTELDRVGDLYDVITISRWAESKFRDNIRHLTKETVNVIDQVAFMQHGPEFEMTSVEIREFAKSLIDAK